MLDEMEFAERQATSTERICGGELPQSRSRFVTLSLAIAVLLGAVGGGCAGSTETKSSATPPAFKFGQVAVSPSGRGWLIESGTKPSLDQAAKVVSFDSGGNFDELPSLPPMAVTAAAGIGDRLVVAGSSCVKAGGASRDCEGQGTVRVLTGKDWQSFTFEPQPGDLQQNAVSIMGPGRSRDTVWLKVSWPPMGPGDGKIRAVEFDLKAMQPVRWTEPSPGLGASCLVEGQLVDYAQSRMLPPPVEPGTEPGTNDPLPISYEVYVFDGTSGTSGWTKAPGGSWSGKRPRIDNMHCTPAGLSTSMPGSEQKVLGWSPGRGWFEADPDPLVAAAGAVPVGNLVTGQQVASISGSAYLETSPGVWRRLDAPASHDSMPIVAISGDHQASCKIDAAALTLSACRVASTGGHS